MKKYIKALKHTSIGFRVTGELSLLVGIYTLGYSNIAPEFYKLGIFMICLGLLGRLAAYNCTKKVQEHEKELKVRGLESN